MRAQSRTVSMIVGLAAVMVAIGLMIAWFLPQRPPRAAVTTSAPATVPSPSPADTAADRAIRAAETQIARDAQRPEGYVALAAAYLRKVRESGDPDYYQRAETATHRALTLQPDFYEGLQSLAWIHISKHEFREALTIAQRLREQRPDDPQVYGLLGDAYVELGEYDRASTAFQQMADLRPGLASYSRAAYMRELLGDPRGATELMTLAVKAGSRRDPEPLAWCLVQLGDLHFNQGDMKAAAAVYQQALTIIPHYSPGLAALGRVRGAEHQYGEAITLYQQAVALVPAPDTVAALGDLFAHSGKPREAEQQYALVEYIERINALNRVAYARQLALFYADHDRKLDEAVRLAENEVERRQDIYSYDTLAWVYYKAGRFADAQKAMTQALRLGTQDAILFFHAGMIANALGENSQARDFLSRALTLNPYFSVSHAEVARSTIATIEQSLALNN